MVETLKKFWNKHHRKIMIIVIVLAIIILLANRGKRRAADTLEFYSVDERTVTEEVVIAGRVRTQERADLAFNRSGRIDTIDIEEGQRVDQGQRLARLSLGQLFADLTSARAQLDIARADADVVTEDVDAARLALENIEDEQQTLINNAYRALLNNDLQAYNDDPSDQSSAPVISGTYLGNEEGEYILEAYSSNADSGHSFRLSGLEGGTYTAYTGTPGPFGTSGLFIQFDDDSNYSNQTWVVPIPNVRSASYITAKNSYTATLANAETTIDNARDDLERLEAQESGNERSARAQANIDQAQARVNSVFAQITDGTIEAPFDGVVGSIAFDEGEHASLGTTVISLIGEERYEMVLNVPEIDVSKVVIGDQVSVTLDAYKDIEWTGDIIAINASETFIEGVPVYETTVLFNNPDDRIRSGMNGQAMIITDQKEDILAVPASALDRVDRDTYEIQVAVDGELETRVVEIGITGSDSFVEIVSGLESGDRVLTNPTTR